MVISLFKGALLKATNRNLNWIMFFKKQNTPNKTYLQLAMQIMVIVILLEILQNCTDTSLYLKEDELLRTNPWKAEQKIFCCPNHTIYLIIFRAALYSSSSIGTFEVRLGMGLHNHIYYSRCDVLEQRLEKRVLFSVAQQSWRGWLLCKYFRE